MLKSITERNSKMNKTIAICNQKGGVGKTVTTVNLGIGLARQGKRVLLVDVDAQGSLTASLGYQHPDQLEETLATVLGKVMEDKPPEPDEGIIHHKESVDLLPANIDLAAMEVTLVNIMSRETILQEYLNTVRDQYDVILLDCCPSLGMLTINALSAADTVIIPMMAHSDMLPIKATLKKGKGKKESGSYYGKETGKCRNKTIHHTTVVRRDDYRRRSCAHCRYASIKNPKVSG